VGHAPPTVISLEFIVGTPSQLSVAVAVPVFAGNVLAAQSMVTLAGQTIAGAKLSSTKIVCTHVLELPQPSVAVHVRVIVSSCGQLPETVTSVEAITGAPSQLSVAVAVPVFAGNVLSVHSIVISIGHTIAGATTSSSKMVCTHVAEFPQSSVAVHVRVIFIPEGQLPEAVTSLNSTKGAVSQLSLAVAVPVLAGQCAATALNRHIRRAYNGWSYAVINLNSLQART
jgi:hypothetical protein